MILTIGALRIVFTFTIFLIIAPKHRGLIQLLILGIAPRATLLANSLGFAGSGIMTSKSFVPSLLTRVIFAGLAVSWIHNMISAQNELALISGSSLVDNQWCQQSCSRFYPVSASQPPLSKTVRVRMYS